MTILIVDDERLVRLCVEDMLHEILGPKTICLHASNVIQAEQCLAESESAVLGIVDYKMPLCRGSVWIKEVHDRYPNMRWVLISGHEDLATLHDEILSSGIDCFLPKPVSLDGLRQVLCACGLDAEMYAQARKE